jgi:phosphoadenosine phosphosulfate reductase
MKHAFRQPLPPLPVDASAQTILRTGLAVASGPVKLACSFSVEDVVLVDLIHRMQLPVGLFALDTGRLNEETYATAESVRERYGVHIDWYFPERAAVEELERKHGLYSFRESLSQRHACCQIRKVEPLKRALDNLSGWVTGLRREQSVTRSSVAPLELDSAHGHILKINPLIAWNDEQVWSYAREQRIPVNPLHKRGYPSIGCAPCTRAIEPGEHPRAGRWWWEDPAHKECGLHLSSEPSGIGAGI